MTRLSRIFHWNCFRRRLNNIKRWAPIILASVDPDDDEELNKERGEVTDMAERVSACCGMLGDAARLNHTQISEQLLHAQMLLPLLRSTDTLPTVAKSAVEIVFPNLLAVFLEQDLQYTDAIGSIPTSPTEAWHARRRSGRFARCTG